MSTTNLVDIVAAHPRVCGENIVAGAEFKREKGSSPRVRGKREERGEVDGGAGLIPACAGKTLSGGQ